MHQNASPVEAKPPLSLLRWVAKMTTFGLHFGVILGAKFATIPLLGRRGGQKEAPKRGFEKELQKSHAVVRRVAQEF